MRWVHDFGDRARRLHRRVHLGFPGSVRHVHTLDSQRATAVLHEHPTADAVAACVVHAVTRHR